MIQRSLVSRSGMIAALLITGCTTVPMVQKSVITGSTQSEDIYVVRRGWHTDIGFPARSLAASLEPINQQLPGSRYLLFGFGDRHYLLTHDNGSSSAAEALWPGPAVILVTGLTATPELAYGENRVIRMKITRAQSQMAQEYLAHSLARDRDTLEPVARGPYSGSVYFAALRRYSALHTCNTWAAELLAAAELPVDSTGVVTASQLWSQVRRSAKPSAEALAAESPSVSHATFRRR